MTAQVLVPVQPPPLQPVNVEPAAGVAVRVTAVPLGNVAEHVVPQEMPAGELVTVPLPAPALLTVSAKVLKAEGGGDRFAALIVTVQVPVPVQRAAPAREGGAGRRRGGKGDGGAGRRARSTSRRTRCRRARW